MRFISFILLLSLSVASLAQTVNKTDAAGKKQGVWKKTYPNSEQLRYEGEFKNDEPIGTFKYYDLKGNVTSTVEHRGGGISYSKMFYPDGKVHSEGKFNKQLKDSTWTFYSEEGKIISRENYYNDVLYGPSISYYDHGGVLLVKNYSAGKVDGKALSYYSNGKIKSDDTFKAGIAHGISKVYFPGGIISEEGEYKDGQPVGIWKKYNPDSTLMMTTEYIPGGEPVVKMLNMVQQERFANDLEKAWYTLKDGEKNGPFVEYHPGGTWKMEERIDPKTQDKDVYRVAVGHQIKRKGEYRNGKLHGKVEYFSPAGKLEKTENYVDGELKKK